MPMNVTKKKKARVARVERLGKKVEVDVEREIGTRVRLARLAKNMSQQELGAEFGLSFQQIQKYEKGTNRVAGSRLTQLAETLNTTPHELLGWKREIDVSLIDPETYALAQRLMQIPPVARPLVLKLIEDSLELAGRS